MSIYASSKARLISVSLFNSSFVNCRIINPIPTTIKRVIKKAAKNAGFSKADIAAFSGHSMRVGAAQDLLCAGHEALAIMRAGGWKSTNVLARYLEHAEYNVWA